MMMQKEGDVTEVIKSFFSFLGKSAVTVAKAPVQFAVFVGEELVVPAVELVGRSIVTVAEASAQLLAEGADTEPKENRSYSPVLQMEDTKFQMDLVVVFAAFPLGGPGRGPSKDDVITLLSVVVSCGCLVATGPALPVFELAAFAMTGYNLSGKIVKMVERVLGGEDVFEPNPKNIIEWLDLASNGAGFSSTVISDIVTPLLRNGSSRTALTFLAVILKREGMHIKTMTITLKTMSKDYEKKVRGMSPDQLSIEIAATAIHFHKLADLYGF